MLVILYLASSNSSVRLVSFRIAEIGTCSWSSQHSCFFRKFHPPQVIVHARPGSRHVVRPSVVMIIVSSTRSFHTYDKSKILMKPPASAGILWQETILFNLWWHFLLTKEARVICSRWHQGHFPPHASTHELGTFLVNWVADNKWMMC